ncbi:MAG: response regulator [Candidatus Omnitrophica bacterium]|nr:response regulator [Candidatus Omnitrophota bacterium]
MDSHRKYIVLFVDDNPVDRAYIEGVLKKHNFQVLLAESGDEALKVVEQAVPDLILLDILLPKVSGIEVCKRLKALPKLTQVPVIFFTSMETPKNLIDYAGYGAVDYLHKSIPSETLVAQILFIIKTFSRS